MLPCPYNDDANNFAFLALRRLGYDVLTGKELKPSTNHVDSDALFDHDNEFATFELRRLGYDVATGTEVRIVD